LVWIYRVMTREKFIEALDRKKYSYEIEGDKVVVTDDGTVWLTSLTSIPPGVEFKNVGDVILSSLTSLPPGVEFNNRGYVYLRSLIRVGFQDWKGNIKGIDPKRLLNKMISIGLFER
jgi:hypothetical protein